MVRDIVKDVPPVDQIHELRSRLLEWFRNSARDYPWRRTNDPFRVLIAEIMLRRTKADQVVPVFSKLFDRYPDIGSIAEAEDEELEKILYPLGLKWRSPAFKLVAKEIKEKYDSQVPMNREELTKLSGVGEYVAGAVLSIAFGKPEWIVDSNIVRLFQRYFGMVTSKEGRRDKHVIETVKTYVKGVDPRSANLALVDFSALICTPRAPLHNMCSVKTVCSYWRDLKNNRKPPTVN
ncbi:MAG: DNA glycosylase [Dehalococcoidia bacterium]|nr:DNA glycosylase [Dehalococcoidia bacterium]